MDWNFYVYMLRCNDGSFYIGLTNDIDRRLYEHEMGRNFSCYTNKRRPLSLVLCEHYQYVVDAIAREKQLKRWSREKKEALFQDRIGLLQHFARRRTLWTAPIKLRSSMHRKIFKPIRRVMVRDAMLVETRIAPHHDRC